MTKSIGSRNKKGTPLRDTNSALIGFGGLLCFGSIFCFIVGLSAASIPITAAGVALFAVGYVCLRLYR
jgi:hypothetical protein